jgi:hypothetical protein
MINANLWKLVIFLGLGLATILGLGLTTSFVSADIVIFEHNGQLDPINDEAWMLGGSGGTGVDVGPLADDAGSGMDAWFVDDNSTAGGSNLSYFQSLTAGQTGQANLGWTLSTTIRIPDNSVTTGLSPFVSYRDTVTSWEMAFGSDVDGDPVVLLRNTGGSVAGPSFTLEGAGNTYHTYDLIYDPTAGSADLFIDGIERISNFSGYGFSETLGNVGWGAGSSADTGQGNFNHVRFSVVPEPSSMVVVAFTFLTAGVFRRRRVT